jgi:hypothetical protein
MKTSDANYGNKKTGESIPSINRTANQLRWLVPSALRAPAAGYLRR